MLYKAFKICFFYVCVKQIKTRICSSVKINKITCSHRAEYFKGLFNRSKVCYFPQYLKIQCSVIDFNKLILVYSYLLKLIE